jgi:cytochrome b pre-mRNA-processing protein 3
MQMLNRLTSFFGKSPANDFAVALYREIVTQARQPAFYRDHDVPDSLDGRFDMIVLHAFLVMRRLKRIEGAAAQRLSQQLFDLLFADMDSSLREIGVGDLGVGKRVKKMAQAFYGRIEAYETGLSAAHHEVLADALRRNLYGTVEASPTAIAAVAAYLRHADRHLAEQPDAGLVAGHIEFPAISS